MDQKFTCEQIQLVWWAHGLWKIFAFKKIYILLFRPCGMYVARNCASFSNYVFLLTLSAQEQQ